MKRRDFVAGGVALAGSVCFRDELARAVELRSKFVGPVVDAHCHAGRGMNFGQTDAAPWTTFNDPEWLLRLASEAGISKSIIFPISNRTYEEANKEIAGYVRKYPDRFVGFAKHDPRTEAGSIRRLLLHEVNELGLSGLKLHGVPSEEMCDTVAELGIPILMHPPRVADCEPVVRTYPQINFILAHLGSFASRDWREHSAAIVAARRYANLYLETSSVVFFPYLEQAARELPAEKLIFGSDGPLVDPRVELQKMLLLELPEEQQLKVLSENILRLLRR